VVGLGPVAVLPLKSMEGLNGPRVSLAMLFLPRLQTAKLRRNRDDDPTSAVIRALSAFPTGARAQEPAFFSDLFYTRPAVRYEETKGAFHYVIPCKQYAVKGSQELEPAICWPVLARRLRMVNGKFDFSDFIPGILTISATQVRFIPEAAKDMEFWNSNPVSGFKLADDPAKITRYLESKEIGYKFGFRNYCEDCDKSKSLVDPSKDAQLIAEFQNVSDALTHFDQVYGRFTEMARQVRFIVAPRNQPTPTDPHGAMSIYSALNGGLAEACPTEARTCLQEYEKYQACESTASHTGCGTPPSCTAICALPAEAIEALHATECWGAPSSSATLVPSWAEVFKEEDADRAAKGEAKPAAKVPAGVVAAGGFPGGWSPQPGWGNLAAMGASLPTMIDGYEVAHPERSCGVAQTY
jgi:hypothetical protein